MSIDELVRPIGAQLREPYQLGEPVPYKVPTFTKAEKLVYERSQVLYGTDAGIRFLKENFGTTSVYFCNLCGFNGCFHDMARTDTFDRQPFQFGYDLPSSGVQVHFHGSSPDNLTYGKIKDYSGNTLFEQKDSFKLAMDDLMFQNGNFKKFP